MVDTRLETTELILSLDTSNSSSSERSMLLNPVMAAPRPKLEARILAKAIARMAKSSSSSSGDSGSDTLASDSIAASAVSNVNGSDDCRSYTGIQSLPSGS